MLICIHKETHTNGKHINCNLKWEVLLRSLIETLLERFILLSITYIEI